MTELQQALTAFWSQFITNGISVIPYLTGCVPNGAVFPYITFDVTRPSALGQAVLTAFVWYRKEDGFDAQVQLADLLDQIAAAIPIEGVKLAVGDGFAILERNEAEFQSTYNDPEDKDVIGGRTSYILRHFNA